MLTLDCDSPNFAIFNNLSFTKYNTVNSEFKKDLKLQIPLHKAFFLDDQFLDSLHKSFLNLATLNLGKEKLNFLNRQFNVILFFIVIITYFDPPKKRLYNRSDAK